jgi:hypothetical protein
MGTRNVANPNRMLLFLFFLNELILISRPARNMIYNNPTDANTLTPSLFGINPVPFGPMIKPESINPKIAGIFNCREKNGTNKMTRIIRVKIETGCVNGGSINSIS